MKASSALKPIAFYISMFVPREESSSQLLPEWANINQNSFLNQKMLLKCREKAKISGLFLIPRNIMEGGVRIVWKPENKTIL